MELYITRHGQTDYNLRRIVQGSGVDSDLNDTGRAQAQALHSMYKDLDFDLIVTSTLKRTHQTMAPFIDSGLPWIQKEEIKEMNWGVQEGKESTASSRAVYQKVIRHWKQGRYDIGFPEGETALDLGNRVQQFIDWLKTRPAERVFICTHGRTLRCLTTLMSGLELREMSNQLSLKNTCVYQAKLTDDFTFDFIKENSTQHLVQV